MEQKKSIGFGFRGWILIIVLFFGFMMFQVFTNFPLNILADFYGGAQQVAMLIATVMMIVAGLLGVIASATGAGALVVVALVFVAMFMGASSNYTVSVAAQYWRREDFSPVFSCVNPIANIFNALAATVTAALLFSGAPGSVNVSAVFVFEIVLGVVGTVLMFLFSAKHIKDIDDKYRQAAGKPLDDALAGRK